MNGPPSLMKRRGARCSGFLNAADAREIIFVRGATESINLVAQTYGRKCVGSGDEIVIFSYGASLEHRALADAL